MPVENLNRDSDQYVLSDAIPKQPKFSGNGSSYERKPEVWDVPGSHFKKVENSHFADNEGHIIHLVYQKDPQSASINTVPNGTGVGLANLFWIVGLALYGGKNDH